MNEELIGKAIRGRRDQVILATKFGVVGSCDPNGRRLDGRPSYVRSACEASLRRLGVDTIDIYFQHRLDPDTPIEETVGALSAWGLAQGDDIVAIFGTKKRTYFEENVAAVDLDFTPADLRRLDTAFPRNIASGQRYPETQMKNVAP